MPSPLLIRNLTSTPFELKLFERYKHVNRHHEDDIAKVTKTLSGLFPRSRTPSSGELASNAESFYHQEVSIRIDPFTTFGTPIEAADSSKKESLRLTFDVDGERYRVDTPCTTYESTTLVPLTPNPRHEFTAVYLREHSFLALFSSSHLDSWMKVLKDETPLSALSVPGTHNSPTHYNALPSVRCQAVSPKEQLENGVRFFDIRVQPSSPNDPNNDGLILVHSVFPISLTGSKNFRDLANTVLKFLDEHPSETVIISMKREGTGNATDQQLGQVLRRHYAGDVNQWYTNPKMPTLGEARKKIVLIRRFGLDDELRKEWDGAGWCINAETWQDNTANDTCPSGAVCVQDFYEVLETENIDKKIQYCRDHLQRASQAVCPLPGIEPQSNAPPNGNPFYLNFLSASNFWKVGCWPEKIAARLNPAIVEHLCRQHCEGEKNGDGSTGIVVCDWVGNNGNWDLVRCIVGMNAKLMMREHVGG